jgi:hypothetical protein
MYLHQEVTQRIIAAAIEVHKHLGPGLLESAYEECLCHELSQRGISYRRQILPIHEAQLLTYLRLSGKRVGLLINFNVPLLKRGIVRRIL